MRSSIAALLPFLVLGCAGDATAPAPQPFYELRVEAPDSVRFGDTLHVQWVLTNTGTVDGFVRSFLLELEPLDPQSELEPNLVFCGIGSCVVQLPAGEEVRRELKWRLRRGRVTAPELVAISVSYRADQSKLLAVDHTWVHP